MSLDRQKNVINNFKNKEIILNLGEKGTLYSYKD